ncbi:MAG: type II toxin-antitoxin system VapC family toxin [Desulfuromonadales bacterium]
MGELKPDALKRGERIALDTVILIYFLEKHPTHYPTVRELFGQIETGRVSAVMASLVFAELLVPAYRDGDLETIDKLTGTLNNYPHLEIIPLTAEIATDAARLRARYGIRTPDAIHAATALAGGAESFITNDQGLVRLEPELKVRLLE